MSGCQREVASGCDGDKEELELVDDWVGWAMSSESMMMRGLGSPLKPNLETFEPISRMILSSVPNKE